MADVRKYYNISSWLHQLRAAATGLLVALHQLNRAPKLLVSQSHQLYLSNVVRHDYSSHGPTCSTSAIPCTVTNRFTATPALPRLHHAPPWRHLPVALALLRLCHAFGRMVSRSACRLVALALPRLHRAP
jgi:hypothetical protein